ncbi:hypothetical protein D7030_13050 [Flavobacteriaceae bacterium AU392]|nr:hypothetical protein D1817_05440 [Flavobacteriaceae bacterium]RKM81232.1 hypothetical protein D7030_13050 [Flavobacteriaceae bacterium AU392]
MTIHLHIIGITLMLLALIHIAFPKYFNWQKELRTLSLINRQMMQIHTFFIALSVLLMGLLFVTSTNDLIEKNIGKRIILGLACFWSIRLFMQLFVYSPKLWKGKKFETIIHIFFTTLWLYIVVVLWTIRL